MRTFEKILRAGEGRVLRRITKLAESTMELEEAFSSLSDDELKAETDEFKKRLNNGETIEDIQVEAMAAIREAAYRVLGLKAYKVQLMGSFALHMGKVAELKTGEGKTLVAAMASYVGALEGKGVHVVTVNDFLAKYQGEMMGRVFTFMGLETGISLSGQSPAARREQYKADITYGTNSEFGFDYLKDNMVHSLEDKVQRGHHFAIVDEVDSILIDEARTPLIISGTPDGDITKWFGVFAGLAARMKRDIHYEIDEKKRTAAILEEGVDFVEDQLGIDNLYESLNTPLISFMNNSIKAKELFTKDKDYVVINGKVQIVDEHTGRVLEGRRYNDGIHQAIEAKESVKIEPENQTMATITLQNYFKFYKTLSGMTGTAETEAAELMNVYRLPVVVIPTNRKVQRVDAADKIFRTEKGKFNAVTDEIEKRHEKGQPVLVGTASVEKSEYLSQLLKKRKIPHSVLNAKENEKEAGIVALAGTKGAVTVSTNMAGRGTDIILGGNAEFLATKELEKRGVDPEKNLEEYNELWEKLVEEYKNKHEEDADEIKELGGLCVIGTERHESRRIDNQLRGRSGRQGDPGDSIFYLSLQDEFMRRSPSNSMIDALMAQTSSDDSVPLTGKMISRSVEKAQQSIESRNAEIRKDLLKYDEVSSAQREVIYRERNRILEGYNLRETFQHFMVDIVKKAILEHTKRRTSEDYELDRIDGYFSTIYTATVTAEDMAEEYGRENLTPGILEREILSDMNLALEKREDELGDLFDDFVSKVFLSVIDKRWRDHLYEMDYLKEGIGLRSFAQKDPYIEYSQEGYLMFKELVEAMKEDIVGYVFNLEVDRIRDSLKPSPRKKEEEISAEDGDTILEDQPSEKELERIS